VSDPLGSSNVAGIDDVVAYNKAAWDREVTSGENPWTQPVTTAQVIAARAGHWSIVLTEQKPVPAAWFPRHPDLSGLSVLCLASGGGQQGPILSAAGAAVTVFDNSPQQLAQDWMVAERDELDLVTVEGDAADLSVFADESFDLIVHPVSNLFMPEVRPVWREAARVLKTGGVLLAGFMNPDIYVFDPEPLDGVFRAQFPLPYSDLQLDPVERVRRYGDHPIEFSHTLADLLGGQLDAGLHLTGFYEDRHIGSQQASQFMPTYFATRAVKKIRDRE